jgi:uncharacterized protein YfaS (alpha-2-macroglobulin family)
VLVALSRAQASKIRVPGNMVERGIYAADQLYSNANLWEQKAILASSITLAGGKRGPNLLEDVLKRGSNMSPYAKLCLAEALLKAKKSGNAAAVVLDVLKNAVIGPETAYVPAGEHPGWTASTVETTAQALDVLVQLPQDKELQPKLAQWLASSKEDSWLSQDEEAEVAWALNAYEKRHPDPSRMGGIEVVVNGTKVEPGNDKDKTVQVSVPRNLLKDGSNSIALRRDGDGEAFFSVEAKVFRPAKVETGDGMRVLRRYEVQDDAGTWGELHGKVTPSMPVRCNVLVWPDERSEGIRVVEPIPAGFEYVETDNWGYCDREEVRDGAVIHYIDADGRPTFFRYYLRAESDGTVNALPATADALRRPSVRANSSPLAIEVGK